MARMTVIANRQCCPTTASRAKIQNLESKMLRSESSDTLRPQRGHSQRLPSIFQAADKAGR
jgi:hypothetical protein